MAIFKPYFAFLIVLNFPVMHIVMYAYCVFGHIAIDCVLLRTHGSWTSAACCCTAPLGALTSLAWCEHANCQQKMDESTQLGEPARWLVQCTAGSGYSSFTVPCSCPMASLLAATPVSLNPLCSLRNMFPKNPTMLLFCFHPSHRLIRIYEGAKMDQT